MERFDVNASILEINGTGGDGAYDLVMRGATADEVAARLREVLGGGFGLTNAGACMLSLHIGPAGSGDNMPM